MKRFVVLFALLLLLLPAHAHAQGRTRVVPTCGATGLTWSSARPDTDRPLLVDTNGLLCANVSVTANATITGFRPTAFGTPLAVTTSAATGTLPAGAQVVATNVGTSGAYCGLGATATVSYQYIAPSGGWFGFAISGDTQMTCITASGTATINTAGGSGLPTGVSGGGGAGGGGGAITAAASSYSAGAFVVGTGVDGWDATQGAKADAAQTDPAVTASLVAYTKGVLTGIGQKADTAWTSGSGSLVALLKANSGKLDSVITNTGAAIPAGSAIIGKVGIDQTTPGTTNAVNTTNWPTTVDTNSGNKSASTPRFVIATDQPNLTTALNVALAANQSVNLAQVAGATTAVGSGVQATALRTTLATDSPGIVTLGQTTKSASVPVAIASDQLGANTTANSLPITVGPALLGSYCMGANSGTMAAGLAGGSPVFSFRYAAANLAIIRKITAEADDITTAFAAGAGKFDLIAARSFTASDTGGTAGTLTGNNGKLRTSFATTGISDFRISSTATLTAGTRTLDAQPLGSVEFAVPTSIDAGLLPTTNIFLAEIGQSPVVLAQNEGFVLQATVPGTGTWVFSVRVCWDEVSAF